MRRYKFQTNEDAVELLRNLVKDSGVVFLTSIKGETFEETSDYVASVILAGGYVGTFVCHGTYHRRVLSCLFHTQNRHIRTQSSFTPLFRHIRSAHCSHHGKRR